MSVFCLSSVLTTHHSPEANEQNGDIDYITLQYYRQHRESFFGIWQGRTEQCQEQISSNGEKQKFVFSYSHPPIDDWTTTTKLPVKQQQRRKKKIKSWESKYRNNISICLIHRNLILVLSTSSLNAPTSPHEFKNKKTQRPPLNQFPSKKWHGDIPFRQQEPRERVGTVPSWGWESASYFYSTHATCYDDLYLWWSRCGGDEEEENDSNPRGAATLPSLLSVTLPGNDMRMGIKYSTNVPYFTISDCSSSERVGRRKFFDCK